MSLNTVWVHEFALDPDYHYPLIGGILLDGPTEKVNELIIALNLNKYAVISTDDPTKKHVKTKCYFRKEELIDKKAQEIKKYLSE